MVPGRTYPERKVTLGSRPSRHPPSVTPQHLVPPPKPVIRPSTRLEPGDPPLILAPGPDPKSHYDSPRVSSRSLSPCSNQPMTVFHLGKPSDTRVPGPTDSYPGCDGSGEEGDRVDSQSLSPHTRPLTYVSPRTETSLVRDRQTRPPETEG